MKWEASYKDENVADLLCSVFLFFEGKQNVVFRQIDVSQGELFVEGVYEEDHKINAVFLYVENADYL